MLLSLMIFIPLLGMIAVLLLPRESEELIKRVTLLLYTHPACNSQSPYSYPMTDRLQERSTSSTSLGFRRLISNITSALTDSVVTLLLLTALLGPICVIASWRNIEKGIKAYMALFLLLETGMLGFFAALDLFPFLRLL